VPRADEISRLMVNTCDEVVIPLFDRLRADQVAEKSPGDLVTVADQRAEVVLTDALRAWFPDATVIGEEAVAADPGLAARIDLGHVWLVDPVDGTGNFVAGIPEFGMLLAELVDGVPVRSWTWRAGVRRMLVAERGAGVRVDGEPLAPPRPGRDLLVGGVTREYAHLRGAGLAEPWPMTGSCTGDYPAIALGERDYLIHNGRHPWDHWPGVLMLEELGGVVRFLDGTPYATSSASPEKVLAARSPEVWDAVSRAARAKGTTAPR
jgi:fructose-1,6-bisphosphatase/inositol monophosphatase family enzyme